MSGTIAKGSDEKVPGCLGCSDRSARTEGDECELLDDSIRLRGTITHIVEITAQYGRLAGTGRAQHNRLEPYRCGISVPGAIRGRRCCVAVHH